MAGDSGIILFSVDGVVSKWSRTGKNSWQWSKVVDVELAGCDEALFEYTRNRIAVALPRSGVHIWQWTQGTWKPEPTISLMNVSAIKMDEKGESILGGTKEGLVYVHHYPCHPQFLKEITDGCQRSSGQKLSIAKPL
ncbi:hypothetical protein C8J56DRAFT_465009 [Mycena floridula]|nr:hypothetical protein C8J56DRAFT_465009 [Mycena floridula]